MNESGKFGETKFGIAEITIEDGDGNLIRFDSDVDEFDDPINLDAEDKVVLNGMDEVPQGWHAPVGEIHVLSFDEPYDPELEIDINLEGERTITGYVKHSEKVAFEKGESEELEIRPGESAETYLAEMGLDKGVLKLRKNKIRESDFE